MSVPNMPSQASFVWELERAEWANVGAELEVLGVHVSLVVVFLCEALATNAADMRQDPEVHQLLVSLQAAGRGKGGIAELAQQKSVGAGCQEVATGAPWPRDNRLSVGFNISEPLHHARKKPHAGL